MPLQANMRETHLDAPVRWQLRNGRVASDQKVPDHEVRDHTRCRQK
jgi:hypothetical protein